MGESGGVHHSPLPWKPEAADLPSCVEVPLTVFLRARLWDGRVLTMALAVPGLHSADVGE